MERIIKSVDLNYNDMLCCIKNICSKFCCVKSFALGKSCIGKDIVALKIGEGKENVLFAAAFHGSEHITTNIALFFAEELSCALSLKRSMAGINISRALKDRSVIIIPRVNPDGCEISIVGAAACGERLGEIKKLCSGDFTHWNANWRGVDINHNFNADWQELHALERKNGIFSPAPTRFGGYSPESEPETVAITTLCRNENIRHALALHSQGEVIYWDYKGLEGETAKKMAQIMASSSGYALDVPTGLASGGGFKDWFIKERCAPGFTVEVGLGKNPLPIDSAAKIYADIREMLTLTAIM